MKLTYFDHIENLNIYTEDNPYCQIRIIFEDEGSTYVYYSDDVNKKTYINRIVDTKKSPHMFFISNMEVIENDEQYETYSKWIDSLSNFQDQHQGEKIDGNEIKV